MMDVDERFVKSAGLLPGHYDSTQLELTDVLDEYINTKSVQESDLLQRLAEVAKGMQRYGDGKNAEAKRLSQDETG